MDLKTYLEDRRTIPSVHLSTPGPDEQQLNEILKLASRTPDHGKLAPWRFLIIQGQARNELSELCLQRAVDLAEDGARVLSPAEKDKAATSFTKAPVVVVLVSTADAHIKVPVWEQELAVGAVGMNLAHACNALAFSAQWLTGWMAYDPVIIEALGLTDAEKVAGFFHIGTPQERPVERARPAVADITTHWRA